eukprot:1140819-Pelagomonas_calceolata.AAC.4
MQIGNSAVQHFAPNEKSTHLLVCIEKSAQAYKFGLHNCRCILPQSEAEMSTRGLVSRSLQACYAAARCKLLVNLETPYKSWWRGLTALLSQCASFSLIDAGRVSSAYVVFLSVFETPYKLSTQIHPDLML